MVSINSIPDEIALCGRTLQGTAMFAGVNFSIVLLPFGFFLLAASSLTAQRAVEVTMGPEIVHKAKFPPPEMTIGADGTGIYVQRATSGDDIILERYGHDLNLELSRTLRPEWNGFPLEPWYMFQLGDGFHLVARYKDQKNDTAFFLSTRIDPMTLLPMEDWTTFGKVDTKGRKPTISFFQGSRGTRVAFGLKERGTETQFGSIGFDSGRIFYTDYAMDEAEQDVHEFIMVDTEMTVQWNHRFALQETEGEFDRWETIVGPEDIVYMNGRKTNDRGKTVVDGKPNYVHRVYGLDGSGIVMEATIDLGEKFIKSASLKLIAGELCVTGFFAEDTSMESRGVYLQKIDFRSGAVTERVEHRFPQSTFVQLYGLEKGERAFDKFTQVPKNGIEYLKLSAVIPMPDGGLRMIGEIKWKDAINRTTPRPSPSASLKYQKTTSSNIFYTRQILIIDLDSNGDLTRTSVVQKHQDVAYEQQFSSFSHFRSAENGQSFFLFNDHPENLVPFNIADGKVRKWNGQKGCVSLVELDDSGAQVRSSIFDIREEEFAVYSSITMRITDNERVILCGYKGNERWIRLRW